MIKRIAISRSYGLFQIPSQFLDEINKSNRNFRLVVAECIDELEDSNDLNNWYIKHGNTFYFKDVDDEYPMYNLAVVEVDTSRKWRIESRDGMENIIYYSEPKLIDKELNMWEW